jgi:hypothetical protein
MADIDILPSHGRVLIAGSHGVNVSDFARSIVGVPAQRPNSTVLLLTAASEVEWRDERARWLTWARAYYERSGRPVPKPDWLHGLTEIWAKKPDELARNVLREPTMGHLYIIHDNSLTIAGRNNENFARYAKAINEVARACVVHVVRTSQQGGWLPDVTKYDFVWRVSDYFPAAMSEREGDMIRLERSEAPGRAIIFKTRASLGINLYQPCAVLEEAAA